MKRNKISQIGLSCLVIGSLSTVCYLFSDYIDYQTVALILLAAVSILAILIDILPVVIAAILSAVILNMLFLSPKYTYKIHSSEEVFLFFVYLFVALISAVFSNRIRKQELKIREKEEKANGIHLYNTLLSSLSHELKTPIATILGAVDILKNENIKEEYKVDFLNEIEIASNRLRYQVENLLNMNRLESGNLRLKKDWTDVNEMIFMLLPKIQNQEKHTIIFSGDESLPLFKIDAGLIETALFGIISNAVKYTPKGSKVWIEVCVEDEKFVVKIKDNGKGIPEEEKDKIFDKFYRLADSGTGGTGLGLSISKGIIEAHGGFLEVNSENGAEFVCKIPAEASYLKNLKNE